MVTERRLGTAYVVALGSIGAALLVGSGAVVQALRLGDRSTHRAAPVVGASALVLLLCLVGIVSAVVARTRVRRSSAPPPALPAAALMAAGLLGIGLALFLAVASFVMIFLRNVASFR
jgi:hypothetical protein